MRRSISCARPTSLCARAARRHSKPPSLNVPWRLGYKTGALSYAIARHVVTIPYIGLVNVVAGREVVREFVQGALRPRSVADELERLLRDTGYRNTMIDALREVRGKLGSPGASIRTAAIIAERGQVSTASAVPSTAGKRIAACARPLRSSVCWRRRGACA